MCPVPEHVIDQQNVGSAADTGATDVRREVDAAGIRLPVVLAVHTDPTDHPLLNQLQHRAQIAVHLGRAILRVVELAEVGERSQSAVTQTLVLWGEFVRRTDRPDRHRKHAARTYHLPQAFRYRHQIQRCQRARRHGGC